MALPKEMVEKIKAQLDEAEKLADDLDDTLRKFEGQDIRFDQARKDVDANKDLNTFNLYD